MECSEVLSRLKVQSDEGLSESEVRDRQTSYGLNQLPTAKSESAWIRFVAQFTDLLIGILVVAAIIAGLMGEWSNSVAILAIVVLNGVLGFIQEEKASRALSALRALSLPMAKVLRSGHLTSVLAKQLVPGDIIELEAGDSVPADARLIQSFSFSAQEASLTGESVPVNKIASSRLSNGTPLGDRENSVFLGTVATSGKAIAVVVATGAQTELGKIAGMLGQVERTPTPLQRRLTELGRVLVVVCLILVAIVFGIQYLRGGSLLETLLVAVSLAVAAVPEGMPAVVTIALALGLQRMVKQNALIRKLPSVETLGAVTVICSDKTGTMTRNQMTVREICVGDDRFHVGGSGYDPVGNIELVPETRSANHQLIRRIEDSPGLIKLLTVAHVCNNAKLVQENSSSSWQIIGDPTEGALIVVAKKSGIDFPSQERVVIDEIPFDSDRKVMSVVVQEGAEILMYSKGAPEVLLEKCSTEFRNGSVVDLTPDRRQVIQDQNGQLANRALRVLAFAYRSETPHSDGKHREESLTFLGVVGMIDPPREEVKRAIEECNSAGILPLMITGDHPATAQAIGQELGLANSESRTVTGVELDAMSEDELDSIVENTTIYARVSASHKLRVVKAWKRRGQVVAMTGDGVNDAPAVQAADIGVAMGVSGVDVTKEAADMVLTDDNFASIVSAVREGRGIFDNIQKFIHYLLSCNAGEVLLMFFAALLGLPLPLIAIQILWINLVTDGLPALALALEPPEPDIMKRKPRPAKEPVITAQGGILILYHGVLIACVALFGFWWVYDSELDNLDQARSVAFAVTAFSQLAFALVCRSHRYTLPQLGVLTNRWLFLAFLGSGLLQLAVLHLPMTQQLFSVVAISPGTWGVVFLLSLIPATAIELAKIGYHVIRKAR